MRSNLHTSETGNPHKYRLVKKTLVLLVFPLAFGMLSLSLGRDINWDLKNYHYYNAYAFLEGRIDYDIAPAQLQTYINPLADLSFYVLARNFPSWVVGFLLGAVHGLNISAVFLIFWKLSRIPGNSMKLLAGGIIALVSSVAPGFVSELGNAMHDNLTSLFVLAALLLLLHAQDIFGGVSFFGKGILLTALSGFILGFGVGVKPSMTIFAISMALVFTAFQKSWKNRFLSLFVHGIFGLAGVVTSAGFWWLEMWQRFGNPFFPFYNHIFKSPYFTSNLVIWTTFLPRTWWEYFVWPYLFSFDGYRVNQFQYTDIRFAILYTVVILWGLSCLISRIWGKIIKQSAKKSLNFMEDGANFLLWFFGVSYFLWIRESATYRFIIPLELLVPICFLIVVERFVPPGRSRQMLILGSAALTFVFLRPFHWGRLDWAGSYFQVDTTFLNDEGQPLVIMLGSSPTSYVVPEFPSQYRFIRPEGNLFAGRDRSPRDSRFLAEIQEILALQEDQVYLLYDSNEPGLDLEHSLDKLGLDMNIGECICLSVNTPDALQFCLLAKP